MTDKELAEKYEEKAECVEINDDGKKIYDSIDIQEAFLAGLKAGRQEMWHDLRKNHNDLPLMIKNDERMVSDSVWIYIENWGTEVGHYDYHKNAWIVRCRIVNLNVLAWVDIPTFKE